MGTSIVLNLSALGLSGIHCRRAHPYDATISGNRIEFALQITCRHETSLIWQKIFSYAAFDIKDPSREPGLMMTVQVHLGRGKGVCMERWM